MLLYQRFKSIQKHENKECRQEESNLRPSLYEGDALPAELCRHKRKDVNQTSQHPTTPAVRLELTTT